MTRLRSMSDSAHPTFPMTGQSFFPRLSRSLSKPAMLATWTRLQMDLLRSSLPRRRISPARRTRKNSSAMGSLRPISSISSSCETSLPNASKNSNQAVESLSTSPTWGESPFEVLRRTSFEFLRMIWDSSFEAKSSGKRVRGHRDHARGVPIAPHQTRYSAISQSG